MRKVILRDNTNLIFACASVVFFVVGVWMLVDALRAQPLTQGSVFSALICPGPLVLAFSLALLVFARRQVVAWRHPRLTATAAGIASPFSRYPAPLLPWAAVSRLACYELDGTTLSSEHWCLVVIGHSPTPPRPIHEIEAITGHDWYFAAADDVLIALPLGDVFSRPTREKGLELLARIGHTFGPELARHQITLANKPLAYHVPDDD